MQLINDQINEILKINNISKEVEKELIELKSIVTAKEKTVNQTIISLEKEIEEGNVMGGMFDNVFIDYYVFVIVFNKYVMFIEHADYDDNKNFITVRPINVNDGKNWLKLNFPDKEIYSPFGDYKDVAININEIILIQKLHKF